MTDVNIEAWDQIANTHESTTPLDFGSHLREVHRSASLLEIGSGYGRVLSYLRGLGFTNTFGVDGSFAMIARARNEGHPNGLVASIDHLPFESGSFDCVLCIATLSSVSQAKVRQLAILEIKRILKDGGLFFFRDFAITLRGRRLWRYMSNCGFRFKPFGNFVSQEGIEFHHFSIREVRNLFQEAGLTLLEAIPESFTTMHGNPSRGLTVIAAKR